LALALSLCGLPAFGQSSPAKPIPAQASMSQPFAMGINLGGLADWGTELPFVDLMKNARQWYTKDQGNAREPWNSEKIDGIRLRPDGYPLEIPQKVSGYPYPQEVATIWAVTDGWPRGTYAVLYDGEGELAFSGSPQRVQALSPGKLTFDLPEPKGGQVELRIRRSAKDNPVRNIRVLMPGSERTYLDQPFNPLWIQKVRAFGSVRFMDWGSTNSWGQAEPWQWEGTVQQGWEQRARMDYYTWATPKGIPYEMMIRLMNDYDLDGWVCIPHVADPAYAEEMGKLFARGLEPGRVLSVEYSNELWNWMFGQTQWLNRYGEQGAPWPERIVPYIQTALDSFTKGFGGASARLKRVVGVQTAWLDVSQRIVRTMNRSSIDAVAPAWYFGLSEDADKALDALGSRASVGDLARLVRANWDANEKRWISDIRDQLAAPLNLPLVFYEGGQHLTAHPFGEEPSYAQALLDIQRAPEMRALYTEWLNWLSGLRRPQDPPLVLMHFSLVSSLSARYGSWGLLETLDQDLRLIPAPKWSALEPYIKKLP